MRRLVTGALALVMLAVAQPAAASLRLVDDDGAATAVNCNAGGAGSAYSTIQAGVNVATSGADTIKVCPGIYAEKVTVNKALLINGPKAGVDGRDPSRGAPGTEALVTGSGTGVNVTTAFFVTHGDVTIDGFTAQGQTSTADLGAEIIINPDLAGITLQNNIVQNAIAGIWVGSDFTTIRHNLIRNNNNPGPTSGMGIYTDQFVAGGAQTGVTIDENTISNNSGAGILPSSTQDLSQSNFTITENTLDSNGNAILLGNVVDSTLARNTATNTAGSAFVVSKGLSNVLITENVLQGGASRGFRFIDAGIGTQLDTGVVLRCNSVTGFPTAGLAVEAGVVNGQLDAAFNWWGASTGPTIASNPGGTGQTIVDAGAVAEYSPFLTDGSDSDLETPGFQCEPKLSVADATVAEGNSGTSSLTFTVTLNSPSPDTVTVVYATTNGTATGADYEPVAGVLKFSPGETSHNVVVAVTGDTAVEPDETLTLALLQPSGATLADETATGAILNDDAESSPPPGGNPPAVVVDTRAPVISLKAVKAKLAKALKKGLAVNLKTDEAGAATITATAGGKVVATGKATMTAAGTKRIVLKFSKKARAKYAKARKLKLTLKAAVLDAGANTGRAGGKLTLSR